MIDLGLDIAEGIDSSSGQIEFLVFYDKIKYIIEFYNFSLQSYKYFFNKRKLELNMQEEEIKKTDQNIYNEYKYEIEMLHNDELWSIKYYYLEYQKVNLIVSLYSEIEKFIDNLNELELNKKKAFNLNQRLDLLAKLYEIESRDIDNLKGLVNKLRLIRNKLIHAYDYWDDKVKIEGSYVKGVKKIDDVYLENIICKIISEVQNFENKYII